MRFFEIIIIGEDEINELNDNVDVEVRFDNGEKYSATFFTIENVKTLFEKNKSTGECKNGLYFWAADMIIVQTLKEEVIRETVNNLGNDKEFTSAFTKIN